MNAFNIRLITVAIALTLSAGAMAQIMSRNQYKVGKNAIAVDYKTAKASCESLSGNAKDICQADAGGKEKVAKAELRARYKPSEHASFKLRVARANADYALAKEKCGALAGEAQRNCVKDAQSNFDRS
jgi:hypothetical protein